MPMAVPSLIPNPSPLVMALAVAALCSVLFLLYVRAEPISKGRMIAAAVVFLAFVGYLTVSAFAAPELCAVGDVPIDPCRICKDLEPWSWEWILMGCWGCGLRVEK